MATCSFRRMSRTKASFSRLRIAVFEGSLAQKLLFHTFNLQVFEGSLARKLLFHAFNLQFLKDDSHESFVFTTWPPRSVFRMSRRIASFSRPQPVVLKEVSHKRFFFTTWNWMFPYWCDDSSAMTVLPLNLEGRTPQKYCLYVIFFRYGVMIAPPT